MNRYLHGEYAGDMDQTLFLFSCKPRFYLTDYVNYGNNRYWSAENFMLIHQVPLYDVIAECFSLSTTRIVEPFNFWGYKFTPVCCMHSDTIFWHLCDCEGNCDFFCSRTVQWFPQYIILCVVLRRLFCGRAWVVAFSFTRSETVWFLCVGLFEDKLHSNIPCTEHILK